MPDDRLSGEVAGFRSREELMAGCDIVLVPKPLVADLEALPEGTVLWGWPHCVQDEALTQVAIDRRQTLIAWEAMNHYTHDGNFSLHVFHKNNELAGYCAVMHALPLRGTTGAFGRRAERSGHQFWRNRARRGRPRCSRSASTRSPCSPTAASRRSRRRSHRRGSCTTSVILSSPTALRRSPATSSARSPSSSPTFDIVVNCILQDTDDPLMFVTSDDCTCTSPAA